MIYGCQCCIYFTNNKYSLYKHFKSNKHISKITNRWNNIFHSYSWIKCIDTRISKLIFLMKKDKMERCNISTQTDEEDFIQKYNDYDLYCNYDADTDMNNNNIISFIKTKKRTRIFKKKKTTTTFLNGWFSCICLLVYLIKNQNTNLVKNVKKGGKCCSVSKSYDSPVSFKKLWKEELNKIKLT